MAKILIIEDDKGLAVTMTNALKFDHHTIEWSENGDEGLERMRAYGYDLVIVDWNLPGRTGVEICREYRSKGGKAPLLMVTGRDTVNDKLTGLDCGFDDYVTKPFNVQELSARVRALLRRGGSGLKDNLLRIGDFELDPAKFKVTRRGEEIKLSTKEFAILELLMRHASVVFSAEALFNRVWVMDEEASPEIVRTHIKNLRKKLESDNEPPIIHTIRGVGYKVEEPKQD